MIKMIILISEIKKIGYLKHPKKTKGQLIMNIMD